MPYLALFLQMFMNSPSIEEVFADDREIRAEVFAVLKKHNVDERELREEAKSKLKHLDEGFRWSFKFSSQKRYKRSGKNEDFYKHLFKTKAKIFLFEPLVLFFVRL